MPQVVFTPDPVLARSIDAVRCSYPSREWAEEIAVRALVDVPTANELAAITFHVEALPGGRFAPVFVMFDDHRHAANLIAAGFRVILAGKARA